MRPENEQQLKEDDSRTAEQPGEAAEEPATDAPDDSDERTPEEAGYGYGV